MFYVYVLYSSSVDTYYIGQTSDVEKRLLRHNNGYVRSTKRYIPWELKYMKEFETRKEAMAMEAYYKGMKSKQFLSELVTASR